MGRKLDKLAKLYRQKIGEKPQFDTKLNRRQLRRLLGKHPQKDLVFKLITKGFDLGVEKDFDRSSLSKEVHNFINTKEELIIMIDTLTKELGKGYIHPGRGLYQLNLLCVPKKDSETGLLTKIRVARHASFAGSDGGVALNDAIPKEETKMDGEEALPSFIMYIVLFLRCWYISLRDLKDAFRQLLLDEADVGTIQYSLFGLTFVDLRQVYGVASAANRCQQFSQTLRWIMAHNATKWTKENAVVILSLILAYIDDYTIGGRDRPECRALTDCFEALIAQKIDVGISLLKSLDCIQVGVTNGIGFRLNAEPKTVFVPILKAFDITMGILGVLLCHWIFGDAWECLIGRILFWAKFDPRAKVWCNYALKDIQLHLRSLSTSQKERTVMHVEFRTPATEASGV